MYALILTAGVACMLPYGPSVIAAEMPTTAKQALLLEHGTSRVLLAKNADQAMAPSSMAKMMTLYVVFEALAEGRITADANVAISRAAAQAKGASLGLAAGDAAPLTELMRAAAIHSANDAAVALAERLAGSETRFAAAMTDKARQLGLRKSRFENATGHSAKNQSVTARDMARLGGLLLERFPEHYRMFSAPELMFRERRYANKNPLLGTVSGADGIKTGQTAAGGYGMVASARRNGRRLILVINGLVSEEARAAEARRLIEEGFARIGQ